MYEILIRSTTDPVTKVVSNFAKIRKVETSTLTPCIGVIELKIENINPVITGKLIASKMAMATWVPDFLRAFPWITAEEGRQA